MKNKARTFWLITHFIKFSNGLPTIVLHKGVKIVKMFLRRLSQIANNRIDKSS